MDNLPIIPPTSTLYVQTSPLFHRTYAIHHLLFGVQQSPAAPAARSASPRIAQLCPSASTAASGTGSGGSSPSCAARVSHWAAMSISLSERPAGLWVVQRTKVVL
ncbi:hypothetical protein FALCPG4_006409 [Fusarium falciforme]